MFVEQDPRNAHDQQASDVPLVGDSNDQNGEDSRNNAQISVSAFIDTRAAASQEALYFASTKFEHSRTTFLRRCRHNSLSSLIECYPDLFGINSFEEGHRPPVGVADKLRHIILNSSKVFQSPGLVLILFSMTRTNETDSRAFSRAKISSDYSLDTMAKASRELFQSVLERELDALNRVIIGSWKENESRRNQQVAENNVPDVGSVQFRNGLRAVAQSALGTDTERHLECVHVYAMFTCPIRGVCVSYFYTIAACCGHILFMHYVGEVSTEIIKQLSVVSSVKVTVVIKSLGITPRAKHRLPIS